MITVTLTPREVQLAAFHAVSRRCECWERGRKSRLSVVRSGWDDEVEAACAEMAVAKHFGCYWTGVAEFRADDVGVYGVRWTKHPNGGLTATENDDDHTILVLVDGHAPTLRLVGCSSVARVRRLGERMPFGMLLKRERLFPMDEDNEKLEFAGQPTRPVNAHDGDVRGFR